ATPTETPTQTATATASPTQTATATASPTETATATATASPTQTATATASPTATATGTQTATAIPTETHTATATATPSETATATTTPTGTATATQTATATATPTETAAPSPRLRVSPTSVTRGQPVTVSVSDFGPTESVRVRWLIGSTWTTVGAITTNASGAGSTIVVVPSSAAIGANKVRGDSPTHAAQTGAVTVSVPLPPSVELSALRVSVGQSISVTAEHFPASSSLTMTWRRPGGSTVDLGTMMTDGTGAASGSFIVPATEGGLGSQVTIRAANGASVAVSLEVAPRIGVSPSTVSSGQAVTVTLRGYGKGETVRIRWLVNGTWVTVGTVTTSNTGNASITVTVPANANLGQNSVRGDGAVFRQQTNGVTVVP
ncbi:MAG: hypothetical protein ACRDHN_16150, partial [Thermomicrobiales bacterium]